MKTKILLGLSIVYLLASVGCKKDSGTKALVNKQTPKLTINVSTTMSEGSTAIALVTSSAGKAGGAITYVIQAGSGSATVNPTSGLITAVSVGTVTLTANSAGDAAYNSATASQLITIGPKTGKASQTVSIDPLGTMIEGNVLTAVVKGAKTTVTYTIIAGSGSATVDPATGEVTAINAGDVTLIATAAADATYDEATDSQPITIEALGVQNDDATDDLQFTLSEFNADGSPKLTFVSTTLSPTKYVVIVRGQSAKHKSDDAINFWGSVSVDKLTAADDAISFITDFIPNMVTRDKKLNRIPGKLYKVAVYAVNDDCTILPTDKNSSTNFLQSVVPGTTTGVLGVQYLEYTAP